MKIFLRIESNRVFTRQIDVENPKIEKDFQTNFLNAFVWLKVRRFRSFFRRVEKKLRSTTKLNLNESKIPFVRFDYSAVVSKWNRQFLLKSNRLIRWEFSKTKLDENVSLFDTFVDRFTVQFSSDVSFRWFGWWIFICNWTNLRISF